MALHWVNILLCPPLGLPPLGIMCRLLSWGFLVSGCRGLPVFRYCFGVSLPDVVVLLSLVPVSDVGSLPAFLDCCRFPLQVFRFFRSSGYSSVFPGFRLFCYYIRFPGFRLFFHYMQFRAILQWLYGCIRAYFARYGVFIVSVISGWGENKSRLKMANTAF